MPKIIHRAGRIDGESEATEGQRKSRKDWKPQSGLKHAGRGGDGLGFQDTRISRLEESMNTEREWVFLRWYVGSAGGTCEVQVLHRSMEVWGEAGTGTGGSRI